jgi:hypothetical protein
MTIALGTKNTDVAPALANGACAPARSRSRRLVSAAFVLFAIAMAIASRGFLEADEITHFLMAKGVWSNWASVTSIWGRIGCTGLYALVAPFGVTAARLLAAGVTTLTCLGTGILVRHFVSTADPKSIKNSWVARHAEALAWLLLFAQPFFALNCFTVMTEMLLACSWVWTTVVLVRCRGRADRGIILAGAVLGLGGLMRPEGWIAVAAWPVFAFLWLRSSRLLDADAPPRALRWRVLAASVFTAGLPALIWYLLGVIGHSTNGYGDWKWVITGWPWAVRDKYNTSTLIFVAWALAAMAVWLWVPIVLGIIRFRQASPATARWQADRRMLLVAPLVGLFTVHGVLGSFGLFGSMALPRYYISVAPLAAVLAVLGLIRVERHATFGRQIIFRSTVTALPLATLALLISLKLLPMAEGPEMRRLDVAVAELRHRVAPQQYRQRIIAAHPYVLLALGLPPGTPVDSRANPEAIAHAPLGTLLVTDSKLWISEGHPGPAKLTEWGYTVDAAVAARVDAVAVERMPWTLVWLRPAEVQLWVKKR